MSLLIGALKKYEIGKDGIVVQNRNEGAENLRENHISCLGGKSGLG